MSSAHQRGAESRAQISQVAQFTGCHCKMNYSPYTQRRKSSRGGDPFVTLETALANSISWLSQLPHPGEFQLQGNEEEMRRRNHYGYFPRRSFAWYSCQSPGGSTALHARGGVLGRRSFSECILGTFRYGGATKFIHQRRLGRKV